MHGFGGGGGGWGLGLVESHDLTDPAGDGGGEYLADEQTVLAGDDGAEAPLLFHDSSPLLYQTSSNSESSLTSNKLTLDSVSNSESDANSDSGSVSVSDTDAYVTSCT